MPGVRAVTVDLAQPQRLAEAIEPLQTLDALVHRAGYRSRRSRRSLHGPGGVAGDDGGETSWPQPSQ